MKNTLKGESLGGKLLLAAAAAVFILAVAGAVGSSENRIPADTREERSALLQSLGHTPDVGAETEKTVRLPKEFPPVLDNYEQLQHSQGFSLKKYAGKEVLIYTCPLVENGQEGVYSALYVYKGRLIGADMHSVAFEGYMQPLFPVRNDENG